MTQLSNNKNGIERSVQIRIPNFKSSVIRSHFLWKKIEKPVGSFMENYEIVILMYVFQLENILENK